MSLNIPKADVPTLETERLLLRRLRPTDALVLHRLRSEEQSMRFVQRTLTTCEQDAVDLMNTFADDQADGTGITWAMAMKQSPDELIGIIGLYRVKPENLRGEVGYTLGPEFWGRGLMSEALQRVLEHAFEQFGFHSLEGHTDPGNQNSKKLLERAGFVHVGSFQDCLLFEDRFYSSDIYELLKRNFNS